MALQDSAQHYAAGIAPGSCLVKDSEAAVLFQHGRCRGPQGFSHPGGCQLLRASEDCLSVPTQRIPSAGDHCFFSRCGVRVYSVLHSCYFLPVLNKLSIPPGEDLGLSLGPLYQGSLEQGRWLCGSSWSSANSHSVVQGIRWRGYANPSI